MDEPPSVSKTIALVCVECETESTVRATGWRAYLGDDDSVVIFCLGCAAREFDGE